MWPWKPTTVPLIEDHPRIRRSVLRRAGGLNPGKVTWWGWETIAPTVTIKVVGADNGFIITDEGRDVQVHLYRRWMICPNLNCERLCRYLIRLDGWKCRRCCGADHAVRHRYRTARRPVISLNKQRDRLRAIDKVVRARLERYARTSAANTRRGRGDGS